MLNKRKTILVVDDEQTIRSLAKRLLVSEYSVLEASDGQEAVAIARSQKPDLILMDLMMPRMDGYSACAQIKTDRATSNIPVVMLTGVGHDLNRKLSADMGAIGYITKPFDLQKLMSQVKQAIGA